MSLDETPTLEASVDAWLVYADALQQRGDPRGELIALSHAGEDEARDAYIAAHAEPLFGPAAAVLERLEISWRYSLAAELTVRLKPDDGPRAHTIVSAALAAPPCHQLAALTIAVESDPSSPIDASGAIAALETLPETCRALSLVDARASRAQMLVAREFWTEGLVSFGPLESLWSLPIEELTLAPAIGDSLELGAIDAPTLRRLAIRPLWFGRTAGLLNGARWPRLEALELRLGETHVANQPAQIRPYVALYDYIEFDEDDDTWREHDTWGDHEEHAMGVDWNDELSALLRELRPTSLRRLALTSFASDESLLASLNTGLPPSVRELSLAHSAIHPESVDWMLEHAALFAKLETLDLSDTSITEADASRLGALAPAIVHTHHAHAPRYRFVAGQE